jgi:hypothetical protein
MRRTLAVGLALALALSIVSPALGGPSPLAVAKKALRVATSTKKQLKRSYNRTHPTEVVAVDGGERSAPPFGFAEWDIRCPSGTVVVGPSIGYGALEPVSDLSYGTGVLVSLFNPSDTQTFSGSVEVNCVWALRDSQPAAARAGTSKRAALEQLREAKKAALSAAR